MDAISNFLFQNKTLTISALFTTFYHLQVIQIQQPNLAFSDVEETIRTVIESANSTANSNGTALLTIAEEDIKAYAGILYEACTVPKMGIEGPMFSLDESLTHGDQIDQKLLDRFIKVFTIRDGKLGGKYSAIIEEWRKEGKKFVQADSIGNNEKESNSLDFQDDYERLFEAEFNNSNNNNNYNNNSFGNNNHSQLGPIGSTPRGLIGSGGNNNNNPNSLGMDGLFKSSSSFGGSVESNKFVARFLAHMRRSGMDMVFPQLIHDKVLMTVFVAAKCAGPIAHRDLIDMILATKDAHALGNDLELVSKTKIRGIVTLARNSHALIVVEKGDGQGETVKLAIGKGITTFKAFRKMHDSFINLCLSQRHLFLPVNVKGEILWSSDEKFVADRCQELVADETTLEGFFFTGARKPSFTLQDSKPTLSYSSSSTQLGKQQESSVSSLFKTPVGLTSSFSGFEISKPPTSDLPINGYSGYGTTGPRGFHTNSVPAENSYFNNAPPSSVAASSNYGNSFSSGYGNSRNEYTHSRYGEEKDIVGLSPYSSSISSLSTMPTLVHGHGQGSSTAGRTNNPSAVVGSTSLFSPSISSAALNSSYYSTSTGSANTYQASSPASLLRNEDLSSKNLSSVNLTDTNPFSTYSTYYSNNNTNYKL